MGTVREEGEQGGWVDEHHAADVDPVGGHGEGVVGEVGEQAGGGELGGDEAMRHMAVAVGGVSGVWMMCGSESEVCMSEVCMLMCSKYSNRWSTE